MLLTRRQFIRSLGWTAAAVAGAAVYPTFIEPRRVAVRHIHLTPAGLSPALEGLTIAHLTDLHRSRYVSAAYLAACVDQANALTPDLFAFTGDYVTANHFGRLGSLILGAGTRLPEYATQVAACIGRARARHGVFACLGNHDHWFDAADMTQRLTAAGATVLRNAHTIVRINGVALPIAGVDDAWVGNADVRRACAGLTAPFVLVLMHQPALFGRWPLSGSHLILAGHTHGGQVCLPVRGPLYLDASMRKYSHGVFQRGETLMYVSRGLGVIPPPVRFNCRPEIALVHLHCA